MQTSFSLLSLKLLKLLKLLELSFSCCRKTLLALGEQELLACPDFEAVTSFFDERPATFYDSGPLLRLAMRCAAAPRSAPSRAPRSHQHQQYRQQYRVPFC